MSYMLIYFWTTLITILITQSNRVTNHQFSKQYYTKMMVSRFLALKCLTLYVSLIIAGVHADFKNVPKPTSSYPQTR